MYLRKVGRGALTSQVPSPPAPGPGATYLGPSMASQRPALRARGRAQCWDLGPRGGWLGTPRRRVLRVGRGRGMERGPHLSFHATSREGAAVSADSRGHPRPIVWAARGAASCPCGNLSGTGSRASLWGERTLPSRGLTFRLPRPGRCVCAEDVQPAGAERTSPWADAPPAAASRVPVTVASRV